jgi:signal transduction histidine kinase
VHKHAAASRVTVSLEVAGEHVLLAVVDDGKGIAADAMAKPQSHGLAGMKHRVVALGGTLTVGPSPGGGTEVRAIVPRDVAAGAAAHSRLEAAGTGRSTSVRNHTSTR